MKPWISAVAASALLTQTATAGTPAVGKICTTRPHIPNDGIATTYTDGNGTHSVSCVEALDEAPRAFEWERKKVVLKYSGPPPNIPYPGCRPGRTVYWVTETVGDPGEHPWIPEGHLDCPD